MHPSNLVGRPSGIAARRQRRANAVPDHHQQHEQWTDFSRWKVGGLCLRRVRQLGGLRHVVSWGRGKVAGITWRGNRAALAWRRERDFLYISQRHIDGSVSE